jgi:hypothetical protein
LFLAKFSSSSSSRLNNHGILIRGDVALGNVYISENKMFGPALIDAYELESNFANYPRLILSPDLLNIIETDYAFTEDFYSVIEAKKHIKTQISKGDNGIWFVDYLKAIEDEMDAPEEDYPIFLMNNKKLIVNASKKYSGLSNISSKYVWLASYHNLNIKNISNEKAVMNKGLKMSDFEISVEESPLITLI